ncbi:40S ribosomal protein S20 [Anaeramoeba ignava]|uniref:Small ribosomal subunit protein uS10 n=1 Tax=Anaeramoeba ignava TaxID=1746090 RepID=A0A9Q0LWA0_ANAIG|nr:40S ribosomal protein S20 [Anaeramoeba ignava]|eukprot:Anaeramoba_ignava/a353006_87.p1 GENE.a353006_87~~a353006_87.p1  ORF type:complete len:122 (-),score=41.48 a353006_87:190-555(-)
MEDIKKQKEKDTATPEKTHHIRVTLNGTDVKTIEKVCTDLVQDGKQKGLQVKGPVRMPTKRLSITTRKTPCGNGTNTWDRYEMRIHKRIIDFYSPTSIVKQLTKITIKPGIDVEVTILESN